MKLIAVSSAFALIGTINASSEPNPPTWPKSVSVFSPSMPTSDIEAVVNAAYAINGGSPLTSCDNGEFSSERFAFLFQPGSYSGLSVPIGYYTSAYGLGVAPTDTIFEGAKGVYSEQGCGLFDTGALSTFWRSAENFYTKTNYAWAVGTGMTWAVSQAAPLRNVKVDNDLLFFEYIPQYCCAAGFASGGWASGIEVGGKTSFGSQQQFMIRESKSGSFDTPVWNGVFVGVTGSPEARCGSLNSDGSQSEQSSISVEASTPLIAEKPYITSTDGKTFQLVVPAVRTNQAGVPWSSSGFSGASTVDFSNVYVTQPSDTSATINSKLSAGLHVVITPGIYALESALVISHPNQVLLGLGFATLIAPTNGEPCVTVTDVPGVRVAGLLLQAGAHQTNGALLQVGKSGTYAGEAANPVVLTDVFARVGGPSSGVGPVGTMFLVQSGYTVIDNTWLWRADHGTSGLVYNSENPVKNGLVVTADNVFAYGLASEHTLEDNVVWEGNNGLTYFYQAEIMYDYLDPVWDHSCYKLGNNVTSHTASGIGCYSYFRDANVYAPTGIESPSSSSIKIDKAVSVWLNGQQNSGIKNTMNTDGLAVDSKSHVQYRCQP